jgi:hypothetical protein
MTDTRVARVTGIGALACVALSWLQFPLWVICVRHSNVSRSLTGISSIAGNHFLPSQELIQLIQPFVAAQ